MKFPTAKIARCDTPLLFSGGRRSQNEKRGGRRHAAKARALHSELTLQDQALLLHERVEVLRRRRRAELREINALDLRVAVKQHEVWIVAGHVLYREILVRVRASGLLDPRLDIRVLVEFSSSTALDFAAHDSCAGLGSGGDGER